jgi:hypothetical protein
MSRCVRAGIFVGLSEIIHLRWIRYECAVDNNRYSVQPEVITATGVNLLDVELLSILM